MFILQELKIHIMQIYAFNQCLRFVFFCEDIENPHIDV
jgi:hypothetical protein